jgi:hypothetical protein
MTLTKQYVADAFLAAARAAGLKQVMVLVGRVVGNEFVVTLTLKNPVAAGEDDEVLVNSSPYEFESAAHVKRIAAAKGRLFAESIPTIH